MQYLLTPEEYDVINRTRLTKEEYEAWQIKTDEIGRVFIRDLTDLLKPQLTRPVPGMAECVMKFMSSMAHVHQSHVVKKSDS